MSLTNEERDYVRLIAREAAREAVYVALQEHSQSCPFEQKVAGWILRGVIGFAVLCVGIGSVAFGIWKAQSK